MPIRITKYEEAFDMLNIKLNDRIKGLIARLSGEGRSEKSICFALWKSQEKIMQFRGDSRFYGVMENEIRKWSWGKDDPRWEEYNKKRAEQLKADKIQKEAEEERKKRTQEQLKFKAMRADVKFYGPGVVYFVQGSTGGPIKIGYTTNMCNRLKELQTGFPDTLVILCAKKGYSKEEGEYHKAFEEFKLKGEWFKPVPEILSTIENIKTKIEGHREMVEKRKIKKPEVSL